MSKITSRNYLELGIGMVVGVIASMIVLVMVPSAFADEVLVDDNTVTTVPIVAAEDATATAGTLILTDPTRPSDVSEPVEDTDSNGFTTFFGHVGDGVCEFAVELGDSWDLEFVKNFTKEHPCNVTITN